MHSKSLFKTRITLTKQEFSVVDAMFIFGLCFARRDNCLIRNVSRHRHRVIPWYHNFRYVSRCPSVRAIRIEKFTSGVEYEKENEERCDQTANQNPAQHLQPEAPRNARLGGVDAATRHVLVSNHHVRVAALLHLDVLLWRAITKRRLHITVYRLCATACSSGRHDYVRQVKRCGRHKYLSQTQRNGKHEYVRQAKRNGDMNT